MTQYFPTIPEVLAVVPVGARHDSAQSLYEEYKNALDKSGFSYALTFVLDGPAPDFAGELKDLLEAGENFSVIGLTRRFGEATAIMAAIDRSESPTILILPAYRQIDSAEIPKILRRVGEGDGVVCRRWPRAGGWFDSLRRRAYHWILRLITGCQFRDLGCGARAFDRRVLVDLDLYGDQQKFVALLAENRGYRIEEIDVRQSPQDIFRGFYAPRDYLRGLLDIFTIFFLARFTKKPLRFFGMVGVIIGLVGSLLVAWLIVERLFLGMPLGERPALIVSSLLVVVGLQLVALGLLGELVIFTHANQMKDYQIERIITFVDDLHDGTDPKIEPGKVQASIILDG